MAPRRPLALLVALLAVVAGLALPAGAHTQVQRATPGPGETVEAPVDFVLLEFLDPVVPTPSIEVTGPDGAPVAGLDEPTMIADDVARVGFDPIAEAGEYRVDYTFVALDGDEQVNAHTFAFVPGDGLELDARRLLAWLVVGVVVVLVVLAALARRGARR